jgi:hypothetical protein
MANAEGAVARQVPGMIAFGPVPSRRLGRNAATGVESVLHSQQNRRDVRKTRTSSLGTLMDVLRTRCLRTRVD